MASTIGTLPIVLSARLCGVDVYVLADGNKVRQDITQTGIRDNLWLTGDKDTLEALDDFRITLGNLVNEKVPANYIRGIITEAAGDGPLTPGEIKDKYLGAPGKAGGGPQAAAA